MTGRKGNKEVMNQMIEGKGALRDKRKEKDGGKERKG